MADETPLDFRNKKSPPPAAARKQSGLPTGIRGEPPRPVGSVFKPEHLTPPERAELEAMGWKEGALLPANLPAIISKIKEDARTIPQEYLDKLPKENAKLSEIDFADLPPAKQEELRQAMQKAIKDAEEEAARQASEDAAADMDPSVAKAITKTNETTPPIVFDEEDKAEEPQVGKLSDTGMVGMTHCPHCGWNLTAPDVAEPTDIDKLGYLQAALGNIRFVKRYSLFNGNLAVTFRTLTSTESDIALEQIGYDLRQNRLSKDDQWGYLSMHQAYMLLMSIKTIEAPGHELNSSMPDVESIPYDKLDADGRPQTVLLALRSHVNKNVLQSESIRKAVARSFESFRRLVEKLEARVDDPDFWKGIDPQL